MSKLCVETIPVGLLAVNCYLLHPEGGKECLLVDPGDMADELIEYLDAEGLILRGILLTHGHFDHIGAVPELVRRYSVPVYVHEGDAELYSSPDNCLAPFPAVKNLPAATQELPQVEGLEFEVLHTPGHTPGGVCFYFPQDGVVISGDTLFARSVGRTDFPGGNTVELLHSICEILFALPDETRVLPGHHRATSIGVEKRENPFVR